MKHKKLKVFIFLFGLLMPTIQGVASRIYIGDGHSHITIKAGDVHSDPKSSSILASVDGHTLTVIFTENLGQVAIEITTATGTHMDFMSLPTPNGYQFFIMTPGDYIVNFTLPNGDEYYGEFSVTD